MMEDLVSIIIPVYNIEKYIQECIESVIAQSYRNLQIIIVDDGSTDDSGKICDKYAAADQRIKVIHKPNGGLTSARNAGLREADGKWIAHIDGDDWVSRDYIGKLVSKAQSDEADIAMCDFMVATEENRLPYHIYNWAQQGIDGIKHYISESWTPIWGGIHAKILYDLYGISSPEGISYTEDFHAMLRLVLNARKITKVNTPLYCYRQRPDSLLHNRSAKHISDQIWVIEDSSNYLRAKGIYDELEKYMCWGILRVTQDMLWNSLQTDWFINLFPQKKHYILSCPFINVKTKAIAWMATHQLESLSRIFVNLRNIIKQ